MKNTRGIYFMNTCTQCNHTGEYDVRENGPHLTAYCGGCGAYQKNLPKESPKFYFGKYNGKEVSKVDDLGYLEWYLKDVQKITARMRQAIKDQISILKLLMK